MPETRLSVALLRGINVGGRNKLPMADLRALFAARGCTRVSTYIQSGNVLFAPPVAGIEGLAAQLSQDIADQHGLRVPVVLRSAEEMEAVVRDWAFPEAEEARRHVAFLADWPSPEHVAALDPERSPGDRFAVVGREVHLHLPQGVARTKLTNAWLDRQLHTVSTARNWRTLGKLIELLGP